MESAQRFLRQIVPLALVAVAFYGDAQRASAQEAELLSAVGSLSASHVYVTFGYVGSIADGYVGKQYESDQVIQLMAEVDSLIDTVNGQLADVRAVASPADRVSIDQIVECFELVQDEARALSSLAQENSDSNRQAFQTARDEAWEKIADLLGLNE